MKKIIIGIILCLLVIWLFNSIKVKQLTKRLNQQEQIYQDNLRYLDSTHCVMDSLEKVLDYLKLTIDSLPIGPPLDTLVLQDDFGIRKHPILGGYQMHSGVDLLDTYRDTIYSTAAGTVVQSGRYFGYGNCIQIKHGFGFKTKYAHLHKMFVKKGENVIKGQPIGLMGSTGMVTGQHLHYEIIHDSKAIDPLPYIEVKATMYHPVKAQCDNNPLITADGSLIDPYCVSDWNWIAISQDMLKKNGGIFNYGDSVLIKGTHKDGIYYIHDCMNRRKTYQIDFLENVGTKQYRYNNIEIYALRD